MTDEDACILATHIDPAWEAGGGYQANLERYIGTHETDTLVYVSEPTLHEGNWAYEADTVFESYDGVLTEDERDQVLDTYETIYHVGGYLDSCHLGTFDSLVSGIFDHEREGSYEIVFPTEAITDISTLLIDRITEPEERKALLTGQQLRAEEQIDIVLSDYQEVADRYAGFEDTWSYEVEGEDEIRWSFETH